MDTLCCSAINFNRGITQASEIGVIGIPRDNQHDYYDFENVKQVRICSRGYCTSRKFRSINPILFTEYEPLYRAECFYNNVYLIVRDNSIPVRFKTIGQSLEILSTRETAYFLYDNGSMYYKPDYIIARFKKGILLLRRLRLHYLVYKAWHNYWYDQRDEKGHSRSCKYVAMELMK